MRKFLVVPRKLRSVIRVLLAIIHQLRWFLGFAVLGLAWWVSARLLQLGDALTRPVLSVVQLVAIVALLKAFADIFIERASNTVKRILAVLINVAATLAALFYVIGVSVRDYESAAALWFFVIGIVLLANATEAWLDCDFGAIILVRAAPLYWIVCVAGFVLALRLYPPTSGEILPWCAAMAVVMIGVWTLPYPQWLTALIERFRWFRD